MLYRKRSIFISGIYLGYMGKIIGTRCDCCTREGNKLDEPWRLSHSFCRKHCCDYKNIAWNGIREEIQSNHPFGPIFRCVFVYKCLRYVTSLAFQIIQVHIIPCIICPRIMTQILCKYAVIPDTIFDLFISPNISCEMKWRQS